MARKEKKKTPNQLREEAKELILQVVREHQGKTPDRIRRELHSARPEEFKGTTSQAGRIWEEEVSLLLSELLRWPPKQVQRKFRSLSAAALLLLSVAAPVAAQEEIPIAQLLRGPVAVTPEPKKGWYARWKDRHPKIRKTSWLVVRKVRFVCHTLNPIVEFGGHAAQIYYSLK